jgi:hypothetical protein
MGACFSQRGVNDRNLNFFHGWRLQFRTQQVPKTSGFRSGAFPDCVPRRREKVVAAALFFWY